MTRPYADAAAFRQALDARIRTLAAERGAPIQGLQLKVAIERLLARLFHGEDRRWLLKGGYAMELRFRPRARATRDVDLAMRSGAPADSGSAPVDAAHRALLDAAQADLGDHFIFSVAAGRGNIAGAPGGGASFGVTATVAGRVFARFGLDVGFGDAEFGAPEPLEGEDFLGFAGCANARALAIPRAQQFAEKIHAYSHPWDDRINTRSRDLVDMVLLIERGGLDPEEVRRALAATFGRRGGRAVPGELMPPPETWTAEFTKLRPGHPRTSLSGQCIDQPRSVASPIPMRLTPRAAATAPPPRPSARDVRAFRGTRAP